jgi:hypothetical protein
VALHDKQSVIKLEQDAQMLVPFITTVLFAVQVKHVILEVQVVQFEIDCEQLMHVPTET